MYTIYLLLILTAAISCAESKQRTKVESSNATVMEDHNNTTDATDENLAITGTDAQIGDISCGDPKVNVVQTIDWHEKVDGNNNWWNDFHTPLARKNGHTYWVWRDKEYNVYVSKVAENGHMETHRLGGDRYQARRNSHNLFSLAVDKDGYIHVTGDMQNGPNKPEDVKDRDANLFPAEFRNASILYWRSKSPENVNDGFEFRGGKDHPHKLPANSPNGIRFFKDNNGVLYSSAPVKALTGPNGPGTRGVGLYRYDTALQSWETIGSPMPEGASHPVFFGEIGSYRDPSDGKESFFNPMFHSFIFDANNRLHFVTPLASTPNRPEYDRLIYAYSDDNGQQWKKMNGNSIPGLPIRGADGQANQGDVVGDLSAGYHWTAKLVPDRNGHPLIRVTTMDNKYLWWAWNGGKWTRDNSANNQKDVPHTGSVAPGGKMILHRYESPLNIQCLESYNHPPQTYRLDGNGMPLHGYSQFLYVDEYELRISGSAYAIAGSADLGKQSLVKITYEGFALDVPIPKSSIEPTEMISKTNTERQKYLTFEWRMGQACVEPMGPKLGIGACDNKPTKLWHLIGTTVWYAYIVHAASGECLTANGSYDGAGLLLSVCTGDTTQIFKMEGNKLEYLDKWCIDLHTINNLNFDRVANRMQLWSCTGTWNQQWNWRMNPKTQTLSP